MGGGGGGNWDNFVCINYPNSKLDIVQVENFLWAGVMQTTFVRVTPGRTRGDKIQGQTNVSSLPRLINRAQPLSHLEYAGTVRCSPRVQ